ncbi:hypothetical protein ACA910_012785 [Epithemia clementina (nom. ined.)]
MSTLSCRIGFIGTGTIASAIVSGLATQSSIQVKSIAVSKRSESKSKYLVEKFPDLVTVYDDNQSLVNDADIIFLTVLPQQTKSVLESIKFDGSRHLLVSLVSTSELGDLCEDSGLPKDSIYKMICLPAVASHDGVCLLTPPVPTSSHGGETLKALLQSLGGVVEAGSEDEMSVMMVTTGLMGSFYGILKNNRDWLVRQGVPVEKASFLVGRQYRAMVLDADSRCSNPTAFEELIDEQTPGGLNEQGLSNLNQLGALEMYDKVQDALLERILGKSDGTLK